MVVILTYHLFCNLSAGLANLTLLLSESCMNNAVNWFEIPTYFHGDKCLESCGKCDWLSSSWDGGEGMALIRIDGMLYAAE